MYLSITENSQSISIVSAHGHGKLRRRSTSGSVPERSTIYSTQVKDVLGKSPVLSLTYINQSTDEFCLTDEDKYTRFQFYFQMLGINSAIKYQKEKKKKKILSNAYLRKSFCHYIRNARK